MYERAAEDDTFAVDDDTHGNVAAQEGSGTDQTKIPLGSQPPGADDKEVIWERFLVVVKEKAEFDREDVARCSWRTIERLLLEHGFFTAVPDDEEYETLLQAWERAAVEQSWQQLIAGITKREDDEATARSEKLITIAKEAEDEAAAAEAARLEEEGEETNPDTTPGVSSPAPKQQLTLSSRPASAASSGPRPASRASSSGGAGYSSDDFES